ncbi:hypothetical protein [Devriesea agamarum]|uniref:hypothetical protein n=1 Tax=Devriesea agamarum TaxID=472569 RepID=UPI0012EEB905|nr:hypothetical protein [Devriesea agamarum]
MARFTIDSNTDLAHIIAALRTAASADSRNADAVPDADEPKDSQKNWSMTITVED